MLDIFKGKKVGIWGFGIVGKSVLSSLDPKQCHISVYDDRELTRQEAGLLKLKEVQVVPQGYLPQFLEMNDCIIPSPGVDVKPSKDFQEKFLSEIDLFAQLVKKPTIALTGSIGKTTTTHVLTHLLNKLGKKALAAGNIGLPLLDAVALQDHYDILVLELSSFQLQYNTTFAPDIALITNFYPNHLDHHADIEEYLQAKGQLLTHQTEKQKAFIPIPFMDLFWEFTRDQKCSWIGPELYDDITKELSDITCHENWQLILSVLEELDLSIKNSASLCADLPALPDRIECIGTIRGVTFYNDSKATIAQATLQAVSSFANKKPIVFLGGLSKGTDRTELIRELKDKTKHVICFGAEAQQLYNTCLLFEIPCSKHATLEDAFDYCKRIIQEGDTVLFSPAGSSFDLFANYVQRGKRFKELVQQL